MQALITINYLSKIFPSYVQENATEASGNNLFLHGKDFCPGVPVTSHPSHLFVFPISLILLNTEEL